MVFSGMRAQAPTRRHLRHWEQVCHYLDTQPYRAVAYPFPSDGPLLSVRLLKRMARYRLVRHRDDCRWQLSLRWQRILRRLFDGIPDEESDPSPRVESSRPVPYIVDAGVDTLYANLLCEGDLPPALVAVCDKYKAYAQDEDDTVETPWQVLGAPLSMFKAGKGTSGKGRGVSWSYILRNAMVMLVLRKTPLNHLLGSVRLSAEALWTLGAREALDGVRRDLRLLWGAVAPGSFRTVRWQLSQIHLCVDVAHFTPTADVLDRLLTRSLKTTLHIPSVESVESALLDGLEDPDTLLDGSLMLASQPLEWASVAGDALVGRDFFAEAADEDAGEGEKSANPAEGEWEWADEQGTAVHRYGGRVSGFAFSPGGDLSSAWYDKVLQERQSGKRWMEPIHRSGGWEPSVPLFRIEARFRRGALRELVSVTAPQADSRRRDRTDDSAEGQASATERWFDDPWVCLDHLSDLWAYFTGLPPEADSAPDVTYRGWMRLMIVDAVDANRSRWQTDPIWELIQRARFGDNEPTALKRVPTVRHDVEQVDAELYGLVKLRAALRGEYLATTTTLSQEVGAFVMRMDEVDAERGRDFAEEVREKARQMGKPVPMRDSA